MSVAGMPNDAQKPVAPTTVTAPSTQATNPRALRSERPPASTQSADTPSGDGNAPRPKAPQR